MNLTTTPDIGTPELRFLEEGFDPADRSSLDAAGATLLARNPASASELEDWLRDRSELASRVDAALARRYIAMTCNTKDETAKARYLSFETEVIPRWRVLDDNLNRHLLSSAQVDSLPTRYDVLLRKKRKAAEIFREDNVELMARDAELDTEYQEIQGAITVDFRGESLTAQQVNAYLEEQDRATREEAWRSLASRRLTDRDRIDDVYDAQIALRDEIAQNAGFANYRDYRFADYARFDYGPEDCHAFHDAVAEVAVPAMNELATRRRTKLGIDSTRPWDLRVSLSGRKPPKRFEDQDGYIALTRRLFKEVDPVFDNDFDVLVRNGLLDLMSRKGKAPGGYMYPVEDIRVPFIFINGVGTNGDIQTLLHEGGHAFHTLACRGESLGEYRESPTEFAEVASMSMELLGLERFDRVYDAEDAYDAKQAHLEDTVWTMNWVATIDAFQDWVYTHPKHDRDERREKWIEIRTRFAPHIDWTGIEEYRAAEWQRQSHLFGMPFYYIEYAIAQIGALQVWRNERESHDEAIAAYRRALALGGSRPLPELFAAGNLRFAMDRGILDELIPFVMERIREPA